MSDVAPPAEAKPGPMSLRAYAKRRGMSLAAVQKAIADGRLEESLGEHRGRRAIVDPELADKEWQERTHVRRRAIEELESEAPSVTDDQPIAWNTSIFEAERVRAVELARRERIRREADALDLAKRKGSLVSVDEVRATVTGKFSLVRQRILGVAHRLKQRLPHLTAGDVALINELLREALEELADARN